MLKLGEKQELTVVKNVNFGVYLADPEAKDETVLLPAKEARDLRPGDPVTVFLYKDSKDRLIATTRDPLVTLGNTALLTVKETGRIGAFLDWGLEKDLLLPFREQTRRVHTGEEVLAALYIDKSSRLCATMNVYPYLHVNAPFLIGDTVKGRIYEKSENFGVFVAVEDRYQGLIPKQEAAGEFTIGEVIDCRVTNIREDGKLDLSARQKAYLQMDADAENILKVIDEFDGVLPFDDKVSPEVIRREFGLTKNAFKRAVGRLLKEQKVQIRDRRIYRIS